MTFRIDRTTLGLAYRFLGRRIIILAAMSVVVGFAMFAIEIAMAFTIQAFFRNLGLQSGEQTLLDAWLPLDDLSMVITLLIVVGTARGLLAWLQTFANGVVVVDFETRARRAIVGWALGSRSARVGEVTTLFNDRTIGASNFITSIISLISRIVVAVLLAASLINLSPKITLLVALALAALVPLIRWLDRRISVASHTVHEELAASVDRLLVGVRNSLLLHIYGTHNHETRATTEHLTAYRNQYARYYFLSGFKGVVPVVVGTWIIGLITLAAQSFDPLPSAVMIAYFYLFLRLVQSISELANLGSYLSLTKPRMSAFWKWWLSNVAAHGHLTDGASTTPGHKRSFEPHSPIGWRLTAVSFGYPDAAGPILDALDVEIAPGAVFVIVGESGAGKSTLLALLLGLETPDGGQIHVTSRDRPSMPLADARGSLLDHIGYVGPESFIVAGSIRDNITYGTQARFTDGQIKDALALADCQFASEMPGGLDHRLTEQGEGLSAGQKQRLSLARALLRQPKVLILDEATANLDDTTEQRMVETLARLKGQMTIVAVTHRKGLLAISDQTLQLHRRVSVTCSQ